MPVLAGSPASGVPASQASRRCGLRADAARVALIAIKACTTASVALSLGMRVGEGLDAVQQDVGLEGLSQQAYSADGVGFTIETTVSQGRDQDHRCRNAPASELSRELESGHAGHMNIGNNTIEKQEVGRGKKYFCRGERLGAVADGTHQIHQGGAQYFVIVDDRDEKATHRLSPRQPQTMP
jgi:hypothetical protein